MKFKVGDKAKVIKEGTHCQEIGAIVKILRVDKEDGRYYVDCPYEGKWYIREDELATISFTKSDLKDGDIVTYRDSNKRMVLNKEFRKGNKYMPFESCKEDLTEKHGYIDCDIIKVERPIEYETVFERKEDILDETEKRYLRGVIRPFKDRVTYIEKIRKYNEEQIIMCIDNYYDFFKLPTFKEKTMYKGMEVNKKYALEELGL